MFTRIVPFGTRVKAEVLESFVENNTPVLMCKDESEEAHVIIGHPRPLPSVGARGELVFTEGGPKGGYWHFYEGKATP